MSDIQDRDGAAALTREGTPIQGRAEPGGAPNGNPYVDLTMPGLTTGARSRKLRLMRYRIMGLRDDTGGKCTLFLDLPGTPALQVVGTYDDLLKLLPTY